MPRKKTTAMLQVRVPEKDADAIKQIAKDRGLTLAELLRRLINTALQKGILKRV